MARDLISRPALVKSIRKVIAEIQEGYRTHGKPAKPGSQRFHEATIRTGRELGLLVAILIIGEQPPAGQGVRDGE